MNLLMVLKESKRSEYFLLLGIILLVPVVLFSLWSIGFLEKTVALQRHSLNVQSKLDDLNEAIKDVEISRLRLMASPSDAALQAVTEAAHRSIDPLLFEIEGLIASNSQQLASLLTLRKAYSEIRTSLDPDRAAELVNQVDDLIKEMDNKESETLQRYEPSILNAIHTVNIAISMLGILALVLVVYSSISIRKEIRYRKKIQGDLVESEQRAQSASQMKSQFLATVSHEIRTPLNGIISLSDLLTQRSLSASDRKLVEIIHRSGKTLLTIINDILDFSKIESGKVELEIAEFCITDLISQTTDVLQLKASEKSVILTSHIEPEVPAHFYGDCDRIAQVLFNLIGNAIKFTKEGSVFVSVNRSSSVEGACRVVFCVEDTGLGIPKEHLPKLFQPFVQIGKVGTSGEPGTGLGLCISQQLIKKMGGEIFVESEVGRGSRFWFELPFDRYSLETVGQESSQEKEASNTYYLRNPIQAPLFDDLFTPKVLVVEDNPTNQIIAQSLLQKLGVDCNMASNGLEAIEMVDMISYDLILMDCQMPILDGYEVTRRIRSKNIPRQIPIIAMTANIGEDDKNKCLRSGMNDYLTKPVLLSELRASLEKWIHPSAVDRRVLSDLESKTNRETTLKVMESFLGTLGEFEARLHQYAEERNFQNLKALCHRFKSSSAAVGAHHFSLRCMELENPDLTWDQKDVIIGKLHSMIFPIRLELSQIVEEQSS